MMKMITTLIGGCILLASCFGPKKQALYKTNCNGMTLQVFVQEGPPMYRSMHQLFLQYGNMPAISLQLGTEAYTPLPSWSIPGENVVITDSLRIVAGRDPHCFSIYLDPKKCSRKEFENFGNCLRQNINTINDSLLNLQKTGAGFLAQLPLPLTIRSVVYGTAGQYAEQYCTPDNQYLLKIFPGGACSLYEIKKDKETPLAAFPLSDVREVQRTIVVYYGQDSVAATAIFNTMTHVVTGKKLKDTYQLMYQSYIKSGADTTTIIGNN